jgi:hypothetical protein
LKSTGQLEMKVMKEATIDYLINKNISDSIKFCFQAVCHDFFLFDFLFLNWLLCRNVIDHAGVNLSMAKSAVFQTQLLEFSIQRFMFASFASIVYLS